MKNIWILSICFAIAYLPTVIGWHAYDKEKFRKVKALPCGSNDEKYKWENKTIGDNKRCPCFKSQTQPLKQSFIDMLSLWPDLMNQLDFEHGESVYGTEAVLEAIWRNQNPEDCSKAKYIISGGWPYGFASRVHVEGLVLAAAMNLNRVYLPHPTGDNIFWETNIPHCKNTVKDSSLNCFYEMFSKCTINDALEGYAPTVDHLHTYYMSDVKASFQDELHRDQIVNYFKDQKAFNLVLTTGGPYDAKKFIPYQIKPILDCSPTRTDASHYYWRAMSAAFIVRPNLPTRYLLSKLHTVSIRDYRSCIAMFVRHGDKGIEMKLIDFALYRDIAEQLWNVGLVPGSNKFLSIDPSSGKRIVSKSVNRDNEERLSLHRNFTEAVAELHSRGNYGQNMPINGTFFITTEDPAVLQEADAWGKANNWEISYTNLFDRAAQTAYKTWDEQHKRGTVAVHDDLEYISMLLNLQYSLQCEAWVCTLASNSCRLIDELRATLGGKANRFYVDLSGETCVEPPCVEDHGYITQWGDRRQRHR
jgi:hypothetical protein